MLIYRCMKIGLLPLLLVNCLTGMIYAKPTSGQEVLDRKINLVADQQPVKTVLSEISKLAEIKFVYSVQKIPARKKVSLSAHDQRLGEVLDRLLLPLEIRYHVSGNQIVLTQKSDAQGNLLPLNISPDKLIPDGYVAKVVTGKVTDETGTPLFGVSIQVKGTSRGTTSGANGNYSISVEAGETLEFTMIGYKVYSVQVGAETTINVQMEPDVALLEQVVVVGYGTQKRSTLTGAIASVSSKTISELPVASVEQALQGRVAGLTVTNNGSPGTSALVRIRGISSISFASDPLYVIDGFPTGNLSNFDTRDIESVEVLKDASAAAIYGSRATNGVIMITTKKGRRDDKLKVALDSYVGTQAAWNKIDLLNTQEYLQYERALNGAAGIALPPRLEPDNFNQPIYEGANQTFAQTNTDWQDAYFKSGIITQHNLSVSGGNEKSRFYSSAGYFKQDGIAQGVNYERGNYRINSDHNISKIFTFGENLYFSYSDQRYDNTSGNRTRLVNVVRSMPYLPVYDPTTNGGFRGAENSFDGADPTNPVEDATLLGNAHNKTFKLLGTAFLEVNFTNWLKFRSTFGVDYVNLFQHQFSPIFDDKGRNAPVATITDMRSSAVTQLYTQQLTFDKTFGRHHLNATAVFETQGQKYYQENGTGNQASNDIETFDGASNISFRSIRAENFLVSYIGRISYEFAEKYLLSAAIRRDGLSIWAPGKKYASFPSASVGWRIDQEPFMKGVPAISELKVRAGYGETGLDATSAFYGVTTGGVYYPWQVIVRANGATYPFNNENTTGNASYYNTLSNPNLEWEKTKQINIGLDLGLLDNRITLSAEYFRRKTDNLILNVPTPGSFGFNSVGSYINAASMQNKGFELQAGYNQTKGAFTWNATGNISFIRNKVLKLNTPNATINEGGDQDFGGGTAITRTEAGHPIQSYYGYVVEGIFQSNDEVQRSPVQNPGTAAGDLKFKDLNGDNRITDADRTYLGSYIPDFSYALNLGANYKNFDLSLFFQGVQGNEIFNAARIISEGMARLFNAGTAVLDAWTPENTDTDVPRAISGDPNQNVRPSTRWVEDGSYLRLKNVILGYTIPGSKLQTLTRGHISNFRVYVSSQNLLTFTGYKGWDPEIGSKNTTLTNGIDYGQYPAARSFQVGLQVGF
ncbi:TonB-linked SusC/RagA family outer membrane protein [Chitinophaga japonensis]|uniref:TonB-linked SusC/RagA family outer membrane protein n=2 Tax=Chitinophaga japonensis TaxID=104662 RepID=A0A562T5A8_CHIJA|nr:TonB-linked SusC/RagA family outer membrane protein [Chitinophaga japonensis]